MHEKDKEEIRKIETQNSAFRSELLLIKGDKNQLIQKSKVHGEKLSSLSEEIRKLEQINKSNGKEFKR